MSDELLTPEEAGKRLKISRTKVFALIARGELPSIKIDRCRRIPENELTAYVARKLQEARREEAA